MTSSFGGFLQPVQRKVPHVTVAFWIIKVLTTGMGETASDFLAHHVNPILAVGAVGAALVGSLMVQLLADRYQAFRYWTAVVMVSVFGTMAADAAHVVIGIPYLWSALGFGAALLGIFALWKRLEGTLDIHGIRTRRRELFYWAVVMATFALGTALGDLTAHTFGFGWLASGGVFALLIALPGLLHRVGGLGEVAAFWWAYVLTRPLGASLADWVAVPPTQGGLGLGSGEVTLALGFLILVLVGGLALRRIRPSPIDPAPYRGE